MTAPAPSPVVLPDRLDKRFGWWSESRLGRKLGWRLGPRLGAWSLASGAWLAAGLAAWALDGLADLGSLALPLVLAAAISALCLPVAWVALLSTLAVLTFNWHFVEPRGSLHVMQHRDGLLLGVMLAVSLGVAALMARQKRLAEEAHQQAVRLAQLLALAEALRQADQPAQMRQALDEALTGLALPRPVWWPDESEAAPPDSPDDPPRNPPTSDDELEGLRQSAVLAQAFGPGTNRFEALPAWYLPVRGAVPPSSLLLRLPTEWRLNQADPDRLELLVQAQALCDLCGQSLARWAAQQTAEQARQAADIAQWRTTWLAAISHDYRTPLATVLGAASSLAQQDGRLDAALRQQLAGRIVDEVSQLVRITDNALQLARLDGPRPAVSPARLKMDWQSPEELVGAVLAVVRQRHPQACLLAELAPGLPLLRCDAVLIVQLLHNLLDNALRYSPAGQPVTVSVNCQPDENSLAEPGWLLIRVADRGPGLPPAPKQLLASPQRLAQADAGRRQTGAMTVVGMAGAAGAAGNSPGTGRLSPEPGLFPTMSAPPTSEPPTLPPASAAPLLPARRGGGLGLALCRAIAQEHGGWLEDVSSPAGGTCLQLRLPLETLPESPPALLPSFLEPADAMQPSASPAAAEKS